MPRRPAPELPFVVLIYLFLGHTAARATLYVASSLGAPVAPLYPSSAMLFFASMFAYGTLVLALGAWLTQRVESAFFHGAHAIGIAVAYAAGLSIGARWDVPGSVALAGAVAPWIAIVIGVLASAWLKQSSPA